MLHTLLLLPILKAQSIESNYTYIGPEKCTSDPTVVGYDDILILNEDMVYHAFQAFSENVVQPEYFYKLCPFTTYNMESNDLSKTIMPLLNNTSIRCGNYGKSSDQCVLQGGQIHVIFGQGLLIDNVLIEGLTFEESYGVSIGAWAYPTSKVEFKHCLWKANVATTLVEMYFNPNERRNLKEEDLVSSLYNDYSSILSSYTFDKRYSLIMDMMQYNEMLDIVDHRKLQGYPSMSIDFKKSTFSGNTLQQAIILDGGGDLTLIDTKFQNNDVGVFLVGALYGSQLYIQDKTSFVNNTSPLFTVYIDSNSILEVNEKSTFGDESYSPACANGVFLENDNSYCLYQGGTCHGNCCAFGNSTCDNYKSEDEVIEVKDNIKIVGPGNQNAAVGEITDTLKAGASEEVTPAGCNGACIGLAVSIPILVIAIAALGFMYYKKKKDADNVPNLGNPVGATIS